MFTLMFFVLLTGEWVGHELLGGRARWRHSSAHLAISWGVCVVVVGGWIASVGGGGGWLSACWQCTSNTDTMMLRGFIMSL